MAPSTDSLLTLLLILEAVPNSSANILETREIWSLGGMMREIILVPFLRTERGDKINKQTKAWLPRVYNIKEGNRLTQVSLGVTADLQKNTALSICWFCSDMLFEDQPLLLKLPVFASNLALYSSIPA